MPERLHATRDAEQASRHHAARTSDAPEHPLMRLQRNAGNGAVARLVQREAEIRRAAAPEEMEEDPELQTKHDPAASAPSVGLAGGQLDAGSSSQIEGMRGGGSALSAPMRARVEPAMGVDLGGVRVHQDSRSDALARGMTAKAFTTGSDVFLRQDQNAGDVSLMAHELTHVVQQSSGGEAATGGLTVGAAGDAHEQEADIVAAQIASGAEPRAAKEEE